MKMEAVLGYCKVTKKGFLSVLVSYCLPGNGNGRIWVVTLVAQYDWIPSNIRRLEPEKRRKRLLVNRRFGQ